MKLLLNALFVCLAIQLGTPALAQIPPDEQVDEPQQVTGKFRLGGEVRDEGELQDALFEVAAESTPLELHDPAYEQYVNMSSVGAAWQKQDAAALADGALQLLEGERILLRPHSKLPADKVLELAAKIATENHDAATLERLKKAAEVHGKKQLASQLAAAGKLGGAARSDEGLSISVEEVSPEEFFAFRDYADRIRAARIAGEAVTLENLKDEISGSEQLQPKLREHLLAQVAKTSAALPKDGVPDEAIAALTRLGGASRGWGSLSDFDPTNKNSDLRKSLRDVDPTNKNSQTRKALRDADERRLREMEGTPYTVTIRNPTSSGISFKINDRPYLLHQNQMVTIRGRGDCRIYFNYGIPEGVRTYRLLSGRTYAFRWESASLGGVYSDVRRLLNLFGE